MQETQVRSLGRENPLEKEMTTYPSFLAWEIPWTEEPGGLQSLGKLSQTRLKCNAVQQTGTQALGGERKELREELVGGGGRGAWRWAGTGSSQGKEISRGRDTWSAYGLQMYTQTPLSTASPWSLC